MVERGGTSFYLLFVILAFVVPLSAQPETADALAERARQLYFEQGPERALPEFKRLLELYRESGDRLGEAKTLGYLGNCYQDLGEFDRALDYLNRALEMKRELGARLEEGKTLSHIGLAYWAMGEYGKAVDYLTQSISLAREIKDARLEGAALNNLSLVYDEMGDYEKSLAGYHRVLELYRSVDFPRGESDTLGNVGGVYLLLGQYSKAMHYYQQSLAISERLGLKPSMSLDLGNLGDCYLGLGQVRKALSTFERARQLAEETGMVKEAAYWRAGKGDAWLKLGKYDEALGEYRRSIKIFEQSGFQRELLEGLSQLGELHLLVGDVASAERSFRRAIDLARRIDYPRGVTVNLLALGDLEWRRKRFEQAAALYQEALKQAREAGDRVHTADSLIQLAATHRDQDRLEVASSEAREGLKVAREIEAQPLEARALYVLGEIERTGGDFEASLQNFAAGEEIAEAVGDPELGWRLAHATGLALEAIGREDEAVVSLQKAVTLIENVRSQLREERFRAGYIEDKYQVYVDLVRLLLKLGRIPDAFFYAEKLRARSYLDLFNRTMPPIRDESQQQAEAELRERIRQLERVLEEEHAMPRQEQQRQRLQTFTAELLAAEREYQALLDDLRRTEPAYASARALQVPPAEEVQRQLQPGAALVEYVVARETLTVFVLTRSRMRATQLALRQANLRAKVELLRDLLLRADSSEWRAPAESLAASLIEPLEAEGWLDGVEHLYLVAHGILHYLPFAALPRKGSEGRFLVQDYQLAYLPSATALVYGNANDNHARESLLALAPARVRLPYAQQEVRRIAEYFSPEPRVLLGTRATESSFKSGADEFRVIHFATHGYFNKLNPLLSGIELEPGGDEDGRLEVHEILALRLNADLVTLSACETALGSGYFSDVPPGDDFVGLTRAFLFAGSPSVLASLWAVDDRSTLDLMAGFYRHLTEKEKATALVEAQRDMLEQDGAYSHPYFWAPFVLVGSME